MPLYRVIYREREMTNRPGVSRKDAVSLFESLAQTQPQTSIRIETYDAKSREWKYYAPPARRNRSGHNLRDHGGRYDVGYDRLCKCGHTKGNHVGGDGRGAYECINHEVGDGTDCSCTKFKAAPVKRANKSGGRITYTVATIDPFTQRSTSRLGRQVSKREAIKIANAWERHGATNVCVIDSNGRIHYQSSGLPVNRNRSGRHPIEQAQYALDRFNEWFRTQGHWVYRDRSHAYQTWITHGIEGLPDAPRPLRKKAGLHG